MAVSIARLLSFLALLRRRGAGIALGSSIGENEAALSEWQNALPPIPRSFSNLLVNPRGNFLHACHNLLNHLNADIQESQNLERVNELTTYKLVKNLAQFQAFESINTPFTFQFRLSALSGQNPGDEILLSPVYGSEG